MTDYPFEEYNKSLYIKFLDNLTQKELRMMYKMDAYLITALIAHSDADFQKNMIEFLKNTFRNNADNFK